MTLRSMPTRLASDRRFRVVPILVFFLFFLGLLGAVGCGGPLGPFAGGSLSGTVGPATMSDWSAANEIETAALETRPEDPYSVTTWFASVGSKLYVPTSMILGTTEPSERGWAAHVAKDARVRIRLGDRVYERKATKVEDAEEYAMALAALETKYELDPADRDPERVVWIYRMDERGR